MTGRTVESLNSVVEIKLSEKRGERDTLYEGRGVGAGLEFMEPSGTLARQLGLER